MSENVNWKRVWAETVDYLVPLLRLKVTEQAIYFHLMRHSRLRGQRIVTTTKKAIGEGLQRSMFGLNDQLMRLVRKRCVAVRARTARGLTLEVFLPREIVAWLGRGGHTQVDLNEGGPVNYNQAKRLAILRREGGKCFYCRQPLQRSTLSLDHLEPLCDGGSTRMENMVACCERCNREKGTGRAPRYLYTLYRMGCLSRTKYKDRMRALRKLQLAAAEKM